MICAPGGVYNVGVCVFAWVTGARFCVNGDDAETPLGANKFGFVVPTQGLYVARGPIPPQHKAQTEAAVNDTAVNATIAMVIVFQVFIQFTSDFTDIMVFE